MKELFVIDVMLPTDLPVPIVEDEKYWGVVCPFCGYRVVEKSKFKYPELPVEELLYSALELLPAHLRRVKCCTATVALVMTNVKVSYSFESVQEFCKDMGVVLLKRTSGNDIQRV